MTSAGAWADGTCADYVTTNASQHKVVTDMAVPRQRWDTDNQFTQVADEGAFALMSAIRAF